MIRLNDEQIAKVFKLCGEVTAVQRELPQAPKGYDVSLEIARNLRVSLNQHQAALAELANILQGAIVIDSLSLGPLARPDNG